MFQPTRPRRARQRNRACSLGNFFSFNPRAHEGRDGFATVLIKRGSVSTHAPTKGATKDVFAHNELNGFNPRAHEGRDNFTWIIHSPFLSFNPRAHEGRDSFESIGSNSTVFQPTRPRRARLIYSLLEGSTLVSTHAPTKGATSPVASPTNLKLFQPTRPRRARQYR